MEQTLKANEQWSEVLEKLPRALAEICRRSVEVSFLLDGNIEIIAPSSFLLERLSDRRDILEKIAHEVYGRNITIAPRLDTSLKIPEPQDEKRKTSAHPDETSSEPKYHLRPRTRWTFETFEHGPYNQVAYFTAQRFANWDPTVPSVYLLASTGSGKTHLAHAIWREALKNRPHTKVACVPSEALMNEYRRLAREGGDQRFREKYQEADLFILDDMQLFCDPDNSWTKSRKVFTDILNTRKERGAPTIIISNLPIDSLAKCEDSLRSRLRGLVLIRLDPPDYPSRTVILKRLLREREIALTDEHADKLVGMILERLSYDMRDLTEGVPDKLENHIKACGNPVIDEEMILAVFGEQRTNPRLSIGKITEEVAKKFGLSVRDLKSRRIDTPAPWMIALYLCKTMLGASIKDIALAFQTDEPTVNSTLRGVAKRSENFFNDIADIREELALL